MNWRREVFPARRQRPECCGYTTPMQRAIVGLAILFAWGCSESDGCDADCDVAAEDAAPQGAESSSNGSSRPPGGATSEPPTDSVPGEPAASSSSTGGANASDSGSGGAADQPSDDEVPPSTPGATGSDDSSPDPDAGQTSEPGAATGSGADDHSPPTNGKGGMPGVVDAGDTSEGVTPPPTDDDESPASSRLTIKPIGTTEAELGYWEYLPPNYGGGPAPLLVFTHGAAWQGEGTEQTLQELLEVGPPNLISTDAWPNERPFIVLAPQNPRSGCFEADDIDAFYRYAVETYEVDLSRVYHTGQSCGAIGAWNYLAQHLDEFVTAAVLISGDGGEAFAQAGCDLGRLAIWGFHNELDMAVNSSGTVEPLNALLGCEPTPDVKLTIYPGETAHDAWTKTYDLSAGHDIYSWLLEHVHP